MENNNQKGANAEREAARFLRQQGFTILEHNFHCRRGEIDLIARDGEHLVFVEVRYRSRNDYGGSLASVTLTKQKRLIAAAQYYIMKHTLDAACRFDVIGMEDGRPPLWIKNAFFSE